MKKYDAAVIGGGILGCFAARELTKFDISTVLIEKREDVCTGISKANSGIIYPGYDNVPGSLKAILSVKASRSFDALCEELQVPFRRCGSLIVSTGPNGDRILRKKFQNGISNGVAKLKLISGQEAHETEPCIPEKIHSALYAPSAGVTDPWQLCYAAYENALANGCRAVFNTEILSIKKENSGYILETSGGEFLAAAVINCAGLAADQIHEMLFAPSVRIFIDTSDYCVFDRETSHLSHIVQVEQENGGKGFTAIPTIQGNLLAELSHRNAEGEPCSASAQALRNGMDEAETILPGFREMTPIRSFAAVRPNPFQVIFQNGKYIPLEKSIGSFVIENPEPGFFSFIGIKTPGVTCAHELGELTAGKIAQFLGKKERTDFCSTRKSIMSIRNADFEFRQELIKKDPGFGEIVCLCEEISRTEIIEAVRRGAVTIDGVKRRCGAGEGPCQGSRCRQIISQIMAEELGISVNCITQSGMSSYITGGAHEKL